MSIPMKKIVHRNMPTPYKKETKILNIMQKEYRCKFVRTNYIKKIYKNDVRPICTCKFLQLKTNI